MTKAKRGMIPPINLFFILFVSRIVVALTYIQSISVGIMASDVLISIAFSYLITMLASIPAYYCIVKHKNPLGTKWVAVFYAVYFVYFSSVNVSRFSYFASSRLNPEMETIFFIVIVAACICYASMLGIESLGRFSMICGIVLIAAISIVVVFNIKNFELINFYPVFKNTRMDIFQNSLYFTSNSIEPAVLLAVSDRVNGKEAKAYFFGVSGAYAVIILLLSFCMGTMGAAASLHSFPIFTLFQMASVGSFSRLDVVHTAFWVLATFLKCSGLIYCASISVKKFSHRSKCVFISAAVAVIAIIMTRIVSISLLQTTKIITLAAFAFFSIVVPLLFLLFKKKRKGDEVLEKF